MFVEVKHVYNCNLYNLILHKYLFCGIKKRQEKMENPPVNMPMGSDSVDGIRQICANTVKAMDEIRPLAATTDY